MFKLGLFNGEFRNENLQINISNKTLNKNPHGNDLGQPSINKPGF